MPKNPLEGLHFLVVGDVMLDRYFWGEVERISPEAPVPVFNLRYVTKTLGGAANVANNLRGLRAGVSLAGVLGEDQEGKDFLALLKEKRIGGEGLVFEKGRPTTVKTRVIAASQQLLRIDVEEKAPLKEETTQRLKDRLKGLLETVRGVILSDYAKGVFLTEGFSTWLINEAKRAEIPVMVDPKGLDWGRYRGATCVTPNLKELKAVAQAENILAKDIPLICEHLCAKYDFSFMVVTMGPEGIYLHHPEIKRRFPAEAKEVYDVSGAGDTVIATLSAFYVAGYPLEEVVELANKAAGVVVGKVGTQPVLFEEIAPFL